MVKKKTVSKNAEEKELSDVKITKKLAQKAANPANYPTLNIAKDLDIAMDFATKTYERFNKIIKSIVLFGSTAKQTAVSDSDIDIIMLIDDVTIDWDQELISWYREELDKLVRKNPYKKSLHINTIKLSTWWDDLIRGDPMIINVIRYGESLIDFGGFFEPLKYLLAKGKIRSTPEAVYSCLERAPQHFLRSKTAQLSAIEGLYWAMVDSAHAALISRNVLPPSPEHISLNLKDTFVTPGVLNMKYVVWYRDLLFLYKKISHGELQDIKGAEIDMWQQRTDEFIRVMAKLVDDTITSGSINLQVDKEENQKE
jgi:predicted nucleotidyltransferase